MLELPCQSYPGGAHAYHHGPMKLAEVWSTLEFVGVQLDVPGWPVQEVRNCACGSTFVRAYGPLPEDE